MGYYEFLADFGGKEEQSRSKQSNSDKSPIKKMTSLTSKAQVLASLMVNSDLADEVKDGATGFPGLVKAQRIAVCPQWLKLLLPNQEKLSFLPEGAMLLIVDVELLTPFFSKDDTTFYPTDNVLRRDKVFETPFLSAAGVKGLLRWAHRMASGSIADDTEAEVLFGKAGDGDDENSQQGLLYCWPLIWVSGNIGLDVINPQDRNTGAGVKPVKYEVVLPKAKGSLYFLLMPDSGKGSATPLTVFLRDLFWLLENGGLSAKKTADWGRVKMTALKAFVAGCPQKFSASGKELDDLKAITDKLLDIVNKELQK